MAPASSEPDAVFRDVPDESGVREPFRMREIAIPQRERLHQDAGFHQDIEGDAGHVQLGVDEVLPIPIQHDSEVEVAVRPVIAARAGAEQGGLGDVVCAAELSEEGGGDAMGVRPFAVLGVVRSHASLYLAGGAKSNPISGKGQVATSTAAGAVKVFREVASGAKTDRTQLRRALEQLEAGDVLLVTRLDRLARSTRDLLNTLATIAERKAGFRSIGDTWADTTTAHGRLMLTVLGGLAEFERELIRARTGEGRARAKARGRNLGRPFKLTAHQRQEALARREGGELLSEIARSYNISSSTISRLRD